MMRDHRPRGATAAWLVLRLYAPMSLGVQFAHLIPEPFVVWRLFHAFLLREGNSKTPRLIARLNDKITVPYVVR
jgi:hypothetical protein